MKWKNAAVQSFEAIGMGINLQQQKCSSIPIVFYVLLNVRYVMGLVILFWIDALKEKAVSDA